MHRLYFIIGCTASGKGSLGRELARRLVGQIVSVDSMKIYRRMDIGTAKPSQAVRAEIPHHCIDIVEPSESFSVAQFVQHADRAIGEIASAGAVALAVGAPACTSRRYPRASSRAHPPTSGRANICGPGLLPRASLPFTRSWPP